MFPDLDIWRSLDNGRPIFNIPDPSPNAGLYGQAPSTVVALCLWGEARGEGMELGMLLVGCVVRNRRLLRLSHFGGSTWMTVCLHPAQFSCFNREGNPEYDKLWCPRASDEVAWEQAKCAAFDIMDDRCPDLTDGATHYFNPSLVRPSWAATMVPTIEYRHHRFYRE